MIRELEAKKANNGGKMPYGAISRTVSAKQCIFPWISVNQVKNELKRSAKLEFKSSTTMYTTSGWFVPLSTINCNHGVYIDT